MFIPPTIHDGVKKLQLQREEMDVENTKWQKAIILYVIGDSPSIGTMKRFIAAQ